MKKILVSGANGFVGNNFVDIAIEQGHQVTGIVRKFQPHGSHHENLQLIVADLTKRDKVADINFGSFDAVLNLAGIAQNNPAEPNPESIIRNNVDSQVNIAQEMLAQGATKTRLISVGSGAIFTQGISDRIHELSPLKDPESTTAYVRSKLIARKLLLSFRDSLDLVIAHPFNHTGPGQKPGFLISDWARKLRNVYVEGSAPDTSLLSSQVNMSHVLDIANAYLELIHSQSLNGNPEYVIGARKSLSAYALVNTLAESLGAKVPRTELKMRPPVHVDMSHLMMDTNWREVHSASAAVKDYAAWFLDGEQPVKPPKATTTAVQ